MKYKVELPPINYLNGGNFYCINSFNSKAEAVAFVQEYYGADDEGNVCLVSEEEEEDDDWEIEDDDDE